MNIEIILKKKEHAYGRKWIDLYTNNEFKITMYFPIVFIRLVNWDNPKGIRKSYKDSLLANTI